MIKFTCIYGVILLSVDLLILRVDLLIGNACACMQIKSYVQVETVHQIEN